MGLLKFIFYLWLVDFCFCSLENYVSYQPEQVHIALGDNPDEIVVTWSTMQDPGGFRNLKILKINNRIISFQVNRLWNMELRD